MDSSHWFDYATCWWSVGKKKVLSMFTGAFSNLYGSVNVISDVLSYSRLFGLSLTTGGIALVLIESV